MPHKVYTARTAPKDYDGVETCPLCDSEIMYILDKDERCLEITCPVCGVGTMLCTACEDLENDSSECDWCPHIGCHMDKKHCCLSFKDAINVDSPVILEERGEAGLSRFSLIIPLKIQNQRGLFGVISLWDRNVIYLRKRGYRIAWRMWSSIPDVKYQNFGWKNVIRK